MKYRKSTLMIAVVAGIAATDSFKTMVMFVAILTTARLLLPFCIKIAQVVYTGILDFQAVKEARREKQISAIAATPVIAPEEFPLLERSGTIPRTLPGQSRVIAVTPAPTPTPMEAPVVREIPVVTEARVVPNEHPTIPPEEDTALAAFSRNIERFLENRTSHPPVISPLEMAERARNAAVAGNIERPIDPRSSGRVPEDLI